MKKILIIGATSAIAEAVAREYAAVGATLFLAARDRNKLEAIATDLRVRGAAAVEIAGFDAMDSSIPATLVQRAASVLGVVDLALIAHGSLPDQKSCEQSAAQTRVELETNAVSVISLCTHLAVLMETQKRGTLAVISSVAGDRGRASNYVYGAAKAAVSTFLSGLRQRLTPLNVQVLTIKPGFVDTPMTATFKKGPLWATPQSVARDIVRAVERRQPVLYTPGFWRWIMLVIGLIPERLFMRLRGL